jgi:nucleoside-diphosphate-sugar epimerase
MQPKIENHLSGKRLLITGASGYLASNLVDFIKDIPCKICRLSRSRELPPLQGVALYEDFHGDIQEPSVWERAMKEVDVVFHFAAQTNLYIAEKDPINDYRANVLPMSLMLEASKKNGNQPDVIFAGTSTAVGLPHKLPVNETFPDQPITIYDTHKLMAEIYLKHYARLGLIRGTTLRLTNVYGPGPKSSCEGRGILNTMARRALSGENLTLYGDGKYIRDYIHIKDTLSAFLLASTNMASVNKKHFVLGTGQGHSISEALHHIAEKSTIKTGKCVQIESIDPPPNLSPIEKRCFIADSKSFSKITGWQPKYSLSEGIDQTLDAFILQNDF